MKINALTSMCVLICVDVESKFCNLVNKTSVHELKLLCFSLQHECRLIFQWDVTMSKQAV